MKIIDQQDRVIENPDLEKGYLEKEQILRCRHEAQTGSPARWHYETVAIHANGGKVLRRVIDSPAQEEKRAWDEYEQVLRYHPYDAQQLATRKIAQLQHCLAQTDYIAAKALDALIGAKDLAQILAVFSQFHTQYGEVLAKREDWRCQIRRLEEEQSLEKRS